MNKKISLLFVALVVSSLLVTTAMADAKAGQKYYSKKLKTCEKNGIKNGGVFASRNDRDTWFDMNQNGKIVDQWKEICPSNVDLFSKMKKQEIQDLYDFCWQYASDGDVPSCS